MPAPRGEYAVATIYADILSVHVPSIAPKPSGRVGGNYPKRGKVTHFSQRSRSRMLRRLAMCRNFDKGLFCTLTYPGEYDHEKLRLQRDLQAFFKRLRRAFPDIRCIWRVEYKLRKSGSLQNVVMPHIHLILATDESYIFNNLSTFRAWLAVAWNGIVAPDDESHLAAGTQADCIHSRKHAMRYAAKYAAKVSEATESISAVGRHWGYWGDWDVSQFLEIALNFAQFQFLKVYVSNVLRSGDKAKKRAFAMRLMRAPPNYGFSAFGLGDLSEGQLSQNQGSDIMRAIARIF